MAVMTCQASPSALQPRVDLSVSCLVVALTEFPGVLESAFVGEALDKHIDGLAFLVLLVNDAEYSELARQ
jgi:hypothetical protein